MSTLGELRAELVTRDRASADLVAAVLASIGDDDQVIDDEFAERSIARLLDLDRQREVRRKEQRDARQARLAHLTRRRLRARHLLALIADIAARSRNRTNDTGTVRLRDLTSAQRHLVLTLIAAGRGES